MSNVSSTPAHLRPDHCYVCGDAIHAATIGHGFWSNTDARKWFDAQPDGGSPSMTAVETLDPREAVTSARLSLAPVKLERIIAEGTGAYVERAKGKLSNQINCADGFRLSVIAGEGAYCAPRVHEGPYSHVEVGFPTERPEPWTQWEAWCREPVDPTETIYTYVPVDAVRALIALHGGETA